MNLVIHFARGLTTIVFAAAMTACGQSDHNAASTTTAPAAAAAIDALTATDAWIRVAPPNAEAMGGYLTLTNSDTVAARCESASGSDFERIEFHHSMLHDGHAQMMASDGLDIPAQGSLTLAPGGQHLMLIQPKRAFALDDQTTLTFHCGAQTLSVDFFIRDAS